MQRRSARIPPFPVQMPEGERNCVWRGGGRVTVCLADDKVVTGVPLHRPEPAQVRGWRALNGDFTSATARNVLLLGAGIKKAGGAMGLRHLPEFMTSYAFLGEI